MLMNSMTMSVTCYFLYHAEVDIKCETVTSCLCLSWVIDYKIISG